MRSEVASFTDAWIETIYYTKVLISDSVASFTDAWIETPVATNSTLEGFVASFTDAWIETDRDKSMQLAELSHLLQMRGLKQNILNYMESCFCRIFYRCVD